MRGRLRLRQLGGLPMPIDGTPGDDSLVGTSGDDIINGLAGNDLLIGRAGNDTLNGDEDHDFLRGGDDNDTLNGGTGDDYLRGGEGNDFIDGGDGFDRAAFTVLVNNPDLGETGVQVGATVDLNIQGVAQDTGHGLDTLVGIEHVSGTVYDDVLTGNGGDNWIWGEGGNDILSGGDGNDLVVVDAGNSTLDGGSGADTAGFLGIDTFPAGVTVSLALQGAAQTVAAGSSMTLSGFENLTGTSHDDVLTGDGADNVLAGDAGDDTLLGGAGADTLYGDGRIAPDTHGTGRSGPIVTQSDVSGLYDPADPAISFDDTLDGGAGDDIMDGGAGSDTASFASWTEGVTVGLGVGGNGFATNQDGTENDQLLSIENISGSAFNDFINGNNDANILIGGNGGDALFGRGGDDVMLGGAGDDFLRGSDGADTLDGGDGWDRVSSFVAAPTAGITFNLNIQGVAQDTGQGMDTLIGIEHASGTVLGDTLIGNGGSNWLWNGSDGLAGGGSGNDNIDGGGGDDLVEVGSGNHILAGGTGTDALSFLGGRVEITNAGVTYSLALQGAAQATEQGSMTTSGFENVSGSLFDDVLTGDAGANILAGDLGSDNLSGGDGHDTLYGDGRIWIDGSASAGGSGPITTFGQVEDEPGFNEGDPDFTSGNDVLNGGKGDDHLHGGRGNDTLTGGLNADRFIIEADSGDDVITDFKSVDTIVFDASSGVDGFADLTLTAAPGNSTLISWGTDDSILVQGVKPSQLDASDFEFGPSAGLLSAAGLEAARGHGPSLEASLEIGFDGALSIATIHLV
jgi:Ca2+-binding RTX toxin-like protein